MSSVGLPIQESSAAVPGVRRFNSGRILSSVSVHAILIAYTLLAVSPIALTIINSFKDSKNIFKVPYALPTGSLFTLAGYQAVFKRADAFLYARNSLVVSISSVLLVLLFGAMAAFALSEYQFRGNRLLGLYMSLGIMIPIRLGTVSIVKLSTSLGLTGTLQGLILVYTAQNLPLAILILSQFMNDIPKELKDAARIDGASEYRIFRLIVPLVRPALFSVTIFTMIPVWNDLWFPLIMAPGDNTRTITLGVQTFVGQYSTNWSALLAALTLAMLPVLIIYLLTSRQLIRGLMAGAVKQ